MGILSSQERYHSMLFAFRYNAIRTNYTVKAMEYSCQTFQPESDQHLDLKTKLKNIYRIEEHSRVR